MKPEEIVARALCKLDGHDPDEFASHFGGGLLWTQYEDDATAALRALSEQGYAVVPREATEEMCEAGWIDKEDVSPREIWRAMLDAASASPLPPDPA